VPQQRGSGHPGNCAEVNLQAGYSVLKDRNGIAQYLLIPNDRIAGIESPILLQPGSPNYWADAWAARRFVEASLHAPLKAEQIGLTINAEGHRSQNQLHIHIDCMRADVTDALHRYMDRVPGRWNDVRLDGVHYRLMRVQGSTLNVDPFRIVAREIAGSATMGRQTILVTGRGPSDHDGFYILYSSPDLDGGTGHAEDLQDHSCRLPPA
jgi:CDP-diacylglycerol pyrophosphatase